MWEVIPYEMWEVIPHTSTILKLLDILKTALGNHGLGH